MKVSNWPRLAFLRGQKFWDRDNDGVVGYISDKKLLRRGEGKIVVRKMLWAGQWHANRKERLVVLGSAQTLLNIYLQLEQTKCSLDKLITRYPSRYSISTPHHSAHACVR
jgi:hypothetical protein